MLDFGFYNEDCLPRMKEYPDNYFSLAIVDPPYGGGFTESGGCQGWFKKYHQSDESSQICQVERERDGRSASRGLRFHGGSKNPKDPWNRYLVEDRGDMGAEIRKKIISWDVAPEREYFEELFRISRNQIIWGGNYFELPPTRCFLIWRKLTISDSFSMAMAEYAWTSFNENAKVFECAPQGKPDDPRFHPCQKPLALYRWILEKYAHEGDTILDTHVGSASSLIACEQLGYKYVGFEIDEVYYKKAVERIKRETAQMTLFEWMKYTE